MKENGWQGRDDGWHDEIRKVFWSEVSIGQGRRMLLPYCTEHGIMAPPMVLKPTDEFACRYQSCKKVFAAHGAFAYYHGLAGHYGVPKPTAPSDVATKRLPGQSKDYSCEVCGKNLDGQIAHHVGQNVFRCQPCFVAQAEWNKIESDIHQAASRAIEAEKEVVYKALEEGLQHAYNTERAKATSDTMDNTVRFCRGECCPRCGMSWETAFDQALSGRRYAKEFYEQHEPISFIEHYDCTPPDPLKLCPRCHGPADHVPMGLHCRAL